MKNENIIAVGEWKGKLFVVKFKIITNEHQANMAIRNFFFFQHKRMVHQNLDQVKKKIRKHYF